MNTTSKCPSSADLRDLLDGQLPDSDQTVVVAHLDHCTCCQQSLEALANPDSSFNVTLLDQTSYQQPDANSAYWPAVKNAEQSLTVTRPSLPRPPGDVVLAFLNPPEDGSHMGTLANFNILRVVGRGGMGIVLHAVDTCLQRDVAIKILDPELAKDEMARKRFCRESRAAASISHENVVAVHQVEEDEEKNVPFLVMELITGESLEMKLLRTGPLSLKEIVHIGMQTAAGLAAAHEKGLVHRDIKPGNILLEQSGQRVKLTDFGLARAAEDVRLTRSGLVAGTPLYMSPEQANGEELDARSDLFSLGVVLYELATGEPPFNGKTPLAVLKRVSEDDPVPLRQRNPEIPEWFAHIVEKLLAKKPADRYQSAREVANTLEHFWALLKSSETVACPKKKSANLWKAIGLGVGAGALTLLLGAVAAFFLLQPRERPEDKIPPPAHAFKGNAGPIWTLAVSKDGKRLAMGLNDGTVKYWDIAGDKLLWTREVHRTPVWALAMSDDLFATGADDGRAVLWNLETREPVHTLEHGSGVRAIAFAPGGKRVATADRSGVIRLWDVKTGVKVAERKAHPGMVVALAFSDDGTLIASGGTDHLVKIWDESLAPKQTLSGHTGDVYSLAFAPTGRYLVSGSWDRTVRLWDLNAGAEVAVFSGHKQDVWSVAFDPQGTLFASAGEDQMVRLYDLSTKKEIGLFRGADGTVLNIRFVPNHGAIIAGSKTDGTARSWNLADLNLTR